MIRTAIVQNGVVAGITDVDPESEWSPQSGDAFPCGADVEVGWTYDGEEFIAPPSPPAPDPKTLKNAAVTAKREAVFAAGFSPSTGPLAGHTLQVRNEADRINWLTSTTSYGAAIAAGAGNVVGATFRTADNATVNVTYAQGYQVIVQQMAAWGQAIMARSWALKDQIDAAETDEELAAIDIEAGWPE